MLPSVVRSLPVFISHNMNKVMDDPDDFDVSGNEVDLRLLEDRLEDFLITLE